MNDAINSLYSVRTVSGSEHKLKEYIKEKLSAYCDDIFSDDIGNVYAIKKGTGALPRRTVALVCAADEPGFVVRCVGEDGKISLHGTGGKPYGRFVGMRAQAYDGTCGILLSDVSECEKIGASDMYFEIGAESAEDVTLEEGDFVSICQPPVMLGKNKISLGVMGDKIFAECMAIIAQCGGNFCFDLCFVFAAQHLLGTRGEKCAAYTSGADTVIAFTSVSTDKLSAGAGAVLCTADSGGRCSKILGEDLRNAACSIGVKITEYADISKEKPSLTAPFIAEGAKTAILGVCCEKADVGANICDMRDIRGAAAIACAYLIFEDEKENKTEEPENE